MREFPPFQLDTVNQCLWRGDGAAEERVLLAPKAFDVLRYLVEHPGRLVAHDELPEALWPKTYVQPEVLKSHIAAIRAVLGDDARKPMFIETMSRRGYRFIAPVTEGASASGAAASRPAKVLVGRDDALALVDMAYPLSWIDAKRSLAVVDRALRLGTQQRRDPLRQARTRASCLVWRTWQALAWETSARVAMAGGAHHRASTCIENALSAMEGFEVPLAAWRVQASAAELETRRGNQRAAGGHRSLGRATALALANSLADHGRLRETFLAAPSVRAIVDLSR